MAITEEDGGHLLALRFLFRSAQSALVAGSLPLMTAAIIRLDRRARASRRGRFISDMDDNASLGPFSEVRQHRICLFCGSVGLLCSFTGLGLILCSCMLHVR